MFDFYLYTIKLKFILEVIYSCTTDNFQESQKNYNQNIGLPQSKSLKFHEVKQAIYERFNVNNTEELKKSGAFRLATDGMGNLDLRKKETWETLYRKKIGILPGENQEQGYGCINGIDIFKYFQPWKVFGLDPKQATFEDIKSQYRKLSKIYHPDVPETGDSKIFQRLTIMYKSITVGA